MSAMGRKLPLGGGVDPEVAELAVEGRAADPEAPRDLRHAAAVMADRETDDVRLDLLERAEMAFAGVQRDAPRAGDRFLAAGVAERRREVGAPAGESRLDRDVRE